MNGNHHTNNAAVVQALGPLAALAQHSHFVVAQMVPLASGKTDKLPIDAKTGHACDATNPLHWSTYEFAAAAAARWTAGGSGARFLVGYAISADDPWVCIDIDGALQADNTWSPLAHQLLAELPGAVVEVSQSGRGLHLWCRYALPAPAHRCKDIQRGIEAYSAGRFIVLGTGQTGTLAEHCEALPAFLGKWFPPPMKAATTEAPRSGPRADWKGPVEDQELLRRAMQSRSAGAMFGNKASFADLWTANVEVLARAYPPDNGSSEPYDRSSADAALASHLAFWSGADHDRCVELMRQSGLYREKYERADYLPRTVAAACAAQTQVLQDKDRDLGPVVPQIGADPLADLAKKWGVTAEHVKNMQETKLIWRNALAASHITAWVAPGNGGKTSVALFAADELAAAGHRVYFFQEDAAAGDLPALFARAQQTGYTLLNSTMNQSTPEAQVVHLRAIAQSETDLQGCVFIFDTLKKYVDLMSKGGSREFFQLLRMLSGRGASVLVLGHTNKNLGPDGKPVFEGVGDVRNDVDEMAYLQSTAKDPFGKVTITLKQDKTRCAVKDLSFELDTRTREVTVLAERVDVVGLEAQRKQRAEDEPIIFAVNAALADGPMLHTALCKAVAETTVHGVKAVTKVLDRYTSIDRADPQAIWLETKAALNNGRQISRAVRASPQPMVTVGEPVKV